MQIRRISGRQGAIWLCSVTLLALPLACTKTDRHASSEGAKAMETRGDPTATGVAELTSAEAPAGIQSVNVDGDREVLVELGDPKSSRPIVYLHGMCGDPREDLEAWGGLASEHGAVIAVVGDVPCPGSPVHTRWNENIAALSTRIEAALEAASARRGKKLDPSELVLIGESMGAARAESLAATFPDRYPRIVLIGSPRQPSPRRLTGVKAVASLAGEKEPQSNMRLGTQALEAAGYQARFWELPEATHGNYGPEGELRMREAVAFVVAAQ